MVKEVAFARLIPVPRTRNVIKSRYHITQVLLSFINVTWRFPWLTSYVLATELHSHLDDLSGSLTQMIDSVNALSLAPSANGASHSSEDPMVQISQILSSHLESLQWIDGAVREIEGRVDEVEKRVRDVDMNGHALGSSTIKQRGFGLSR